jgi:hypothetical protein
MDRGLISQKGRGLSANVAGIFGFRIYFSMEKMRWTRSTTHGSLVALVHGGPWPWSAEELTEAWPSGRFRARWLAGDGTTERGEHGESILGLTGARAAVW